MALSLLSGCVGTAGETAAESEAETSAEPAAVINIENDAITETEEIVRMGLDGSLLPALEGVTTAADNAELAPVYLKTGDDHSAVRRIQERLMSLGFMDNDEPTTYYGNATAEAVKHFQRQLDMEEDGICGPGTWDALFSASAPYYNASNGDSGTDIIQMQQRLYELGYLTADSVTGYFGDTTEEAVKKLQDTNAIGVDGTVGQQTYNLLYSDEVKANIIALGEESELVRRYQEKLEALGYLRGEADGNFGNATQNAIREFQSRNDLVVDGYLGPGTMAALDSGNSKPFALRVGDESSSVTYIQQRLNHYGYLSSSHITGYYGSITEAAVKQFQRYNGLSQDGTVGVQTMAELESSSATKKPANVPQATGGGSSSGGSTSRPSGGSSGVSSGVGSGGATVSGSANALVNEASKHLGKPYVWGAKGPNSFDCSGFVYYCLNQVGVSQSYLTSSGWRNPGRYQRISNFDSIQAGDIVVVSGHVGIAAGGGTIIDASSSNGRVVHRSLSSWWRNNFIVAWRIFG